MAYTRQSIFISSTGTFEGEWMYIHCIDYTKFAELVNDGRSDNSDDITAYTFKPGTVMGGEFKKIRLESGAVIAYQ
jgi:hypothetical protein